MVTFRVKETATGKRVKCSRDIYESMKELARADQESFWVLGYNARGKEIFRKCLFVGGMSDAHVDSKIVFNRLLVSGASCWAAVHNHPGGYPYPSPEDNALTGKLRHGSETLGLKMADHIIVGDDEYYSFADSQWKTLEKTGWAEVTCRDIRPLRLSLRLENFYSDLRLKYNADGLLFPLGDFHEAYFTEAERISDVLDLPLTYPGEGSFPVCRVPNDMVRECIEQLKERCCVRLAVVREVLREEVADLGRSGLHGNAKNRKRLSGQRKTAPSGSGEEDAKGKPPLKKGVIASYLSIKKEYADSILLFQVGNYHEAYFEDAKLVSRILEIPLTYCRDGKASDPIPGCRVPIDQLYRYVQQLTNRGFRVTIVEKVA